MENRYPENIPRQTEISPEVFEKNDLNIDFVTRTTLKKYDPEQKSVLILERVKQGRILVFEGGLDPIDEAKLIERTMMEIDHEKFMGIEVCSPQMSSGRLIRKKNEQKITIVAPSNFEMSVKTI